MSPFNRLWLSLILVPISVTFAVPANSQTPSNCSVVELPNPPRRAYECAGGLLVELEAAARLGFVDRIGSGPPQRLIINGGAALIEVKRQQWSTQIRTPHAIAAVRGTVYAVDVSTKSTAVLVQRGQVAVRHRRGGDEVILGPGQGVDVTPGTALAVKKWGAKRVADLLARFGR